MLIKNDSERKNEEKIKKLFLKYDLSEEELEKTIDKLYQISSIFFDLWLESKNKKYDGKIH